MARRPRVVVATWLAAVALGLALLPWLLSSLTAPPYEVSGSDSQRAAAQLQRAFPMMGTESMVLVLRSERLTVREDGYRAAISASVNALYRQPGVRTVIELPLVGGTNPAPVLAPLGRLYSDERTAYLMVNVTGEAGEQQQRAPAQRQAVDDVAHAASGGAVSAYLVGMPIIGHDLQEIQIDELARVELIAVPVALLVLVLGLRAPVAAVLPIVVAGAGVGTTLGILALLGSMVVPNAMLLIGATAVGLGVGTDYTLFMVSRYREEIAAGASPQRAVAVATATSGRTAVYAGLVLLMAVLCLLMLRWTMFAQYVVGISVVIVVEVLAALTLAPAALVLLTRRLEWRPWGQRRPSAPPAAGAEGVLARWARHLMRRPWPYLISIATGLIVLAAPATGLKLGLDLERPVLGGSPAGVGLELLEREPSRGLPAMTIVLVGRSANTPAPSVEPLLAQLRADPLVAAVTSLDNGRDTTAVFTVPRVAADSPQLVELVHRIRGDIAPRSAPPGAEVLVGGPGPMHVDIVDECADRMWWVIGAVLALLFGLLVFLFRSVLLPLKAIAMNVLVTSATFGLLVLIFQHGVGADVLGFTSTGSIWAPVPVLVFVVVFGVSLDYEIFLVRRIQEEYQARGDNTAAVMAGLQRTARPITLAAMMMVVAFGPLVATSIVGTKELGFAVAVAIILDATIVRLALVPALMEVLGRWNWWLPFTGPHRGATDIPGAPRHTTRRATPARAGTRG